MKEKLRQLARLTEVRKARERLSEAAVAAEVGKLYAVEQRLSAVKEREAKDAGEMRRAMAVGESTEWMQPFALSVVDGRDRARCEAERRERLAAVEAARGVLRLRRTEAEQVEVLRWDAMEAIALEEARRAQAESDDRFLARSRWLASREGVKTLIENA